MTFLLFYGWELMSVIIDALRGGVKLKNQCAHSLLVNPLETVQVCNNAQMVDEE